MASAFPTSSNEDPFADRRSSPRVSVALPAFLMANEGRHSVHLLDVSAGGAKLACSISIPSGSAVQLDCGTLARSAVVRWQTGEQMGICFDSELDPRDVAALIGRSTALAARMEARE